MTSCRSKQRTTRRDRRLAKASGWARAGTTNPKVVVHHPYKSPFAAGGRVKISRTAPEKPPKTIIDEGCATTSLRGLLRAALDREEA